MFGRDEIDDTTVAAPPTHVAIIMDGNGRWASKRLMPRFEGHRRGVEALRRTVRAAAELGIRYLTLYSFSSENWSRPRTEVDYLMGLVMRFVRNDLADLLDHCLKLFDTSAFKLFFQLGFLSQQFLVCRHVHSFVIIGTGSYLKAKGLDWIKFMPDHADQYGNRLSAALCAW